MARDNIDFSKVRKEVERFCGEVNGEFKMGGVGGRHATCTIERGDRNDFVRVSPKSDESAMGTVQSGRLSSEIPGIKKADFNPDEEMLRLDGMKITLRIQKDDVDFLPEWA